MILYDRIAFAAELGAFITLKVRVSSLLLFR
jgi:hypothetical protein